MIQTLYSVQYITRFSSMVMVQNLTFDRIKDSAVFIQDQAMHIPARVGLLLLRQPSLCECSALCCISEVQSTTSFPVGVSELLRCPVCPVLRQIEFGAKGLDVLLYHVLVACISIKSILVTPHMRHVIRLSIPALEQHLTRRQPHPVERFHACTVSCEHYEPLEPSKRPCGCHDHAFRQVQPPNMKPHRQGTHTSRCVYNASHMSPASNELALAHL